MSGSKPNHANRTPNGRQPPATAPTVAAGYFALLAAAMIWAYWPTLTEVYSAWLNQPDYSHGFLVLPIAATFLWLRRTEAPWSSVRPSLGGLAVIGVVCAMRLLAGRYYLQPLDAWTIPLWVIGAVWVAFGFELLKWSLPAIIFLWFMFPIPYTAESWLSGPLQSVATQVSTAGLVMLGQPALSEGNTIWLGEHQIFVEEACSGLRIFIGIFALAFAFVLFSRWAWWQKAVALVTALPIAIVANATRIIVTGLLFELASGDAAKKFMHDFSGVAMIPFAAVLFWAFYIYLDRLFPTVELYSPVGRMAADTDS
jgi:exosortase